MPILPSQNYRKWIQESPRLVSEQIDLGSNWTLNHLSISKYRLSWIENTGELYAVNLYTADEFILIATIPTEPELDRILSDWTDITPHLEQMIAIIHSRL